MVHVLLVSGASCPASARGHCAFPMIHYHDYVQPKRFYNVEPTDIYIHDIRHM